MTLAWDDELGLQWPGDDVRQGTLRQGEASMDTPFVLAGSSRRHPHVITARRGVSAGDAKRIYA